jgi:iron(III) transport system permease protein
VLGYTRVAAPRGGRRTLARGSGWTLAAWAVAAIVAVPVLAVCANLLSPRPDVWAHLASTILGELVVNTLALLLAVGLGTAGLGTWLAWLVSTREFPARRLFDWALVLPMAVPAYVIGFVFLAWLDYTGPVQTAMRQWFGPGAGLPDVRALWGVALVMTLVLYPYVYLLARSAFAELGASPIEAARSLGRSPRQAFWSVALPLARPAIATGTALALMETLADFGTVSIFGYRTFTVAIYRVWFGMFDRVAGGQLAAALMLFAAALLLAERALRGSRRYVQSGGRHASRALPRLRGLRALAATSACATVTAVAFVVPVATLTWWAAQGEARIDTARYVDLVRNSLTLASIAAAAAVTAGLALAYGLRLARSRPLEWAARTASLGYAVPGSVIAVGVLVVLAAADRGLMPVLAEMTGGPVGLVLTGSAVGLIFAYLVRFISVAFHTVEAGLTRIAPSLEESARSLGARPSRVLSEIHLPLLRGTLLTALILVFVDVMKEMPATMLIRPFGWDTLAVEVWQFTTESLWEQAALPALTIVAAGLLPVVLLTRLRATRERFSRALAADPVGVAPMPPETLQGR